MVEGNTIKLADFGWAVHTDTGVRKSVCGTVEYFPNEMVKKIEYTYAADMWCVGVLAYELRYGRAPFYAKTDKEIK